MAGEGRIGRAEPQMEGDRVELARLTRLGSASGVSETHME